MASTDPMSSGPGRVLGLAHASSRLDAEGERRFVECLRHGSMSVELFRPRGVDEQQPHEQDELYVVVAGRAEFTCGGSCRNVGLGDLLFVPAGLPHRFERFSPDFTVWVIFYGPRGGE